MELQLKSSLHALRQRPQAVELTPGQQLARLTSSLAHLGAPLAERMLLDLALENQAALVRRVIFEVADLVC